MGSPARTSGHPTLREAYRSVQDRIAAAAVRSGRRPADVVCVAVTKYASPDQIRQLVEMGHADLGENRVQQLVQRVAQLDEFLSRRRTLAGVVIKSEHAPSAPATVRWHMVGHLQRNKVRAVLPLVKLVHSVDSLRLAEEIHAAAAKLEHPIDILLQVNVSGEESKFGVAAPAAIHLAEQIETMMNLRLRGLMTIAPEVDNPEEVRPIFTRTAELFHEIRKAGFGAQHFNLLSMGMTDDFEVAIEEGANVVRIGRAIFGEPENREPIDVRGPATG